MRLELICSGLTELLVDNNYSPTTINFYKREWKKLNDFLLLEYGDDVFSIDKGLIFLEKIHGIVSSFEESKLKDQQMQLIRSIQILRIINFMVCLLDDIMHLKIQSNWRVII